MKQFRKKKLNNRRFQGESTGITVRGTIFKHRKGFGFLSCDDDSKLLLGSDKDVFIAASRMGSAMDGDEVVVELTPPETWRGTSGIRVAADDDQAFRPARPEGKVVGVSKRKITEVAGTFQVASQKGNRRICYVIPSGREINEQIIIDKHASSGARHGDRVMVKITRYPGRYKAAEGKVTEIISRRGEAGGDIKLIARSHGMRETFPSRVRAESRNLKRLHDKAYSPDADVTETGRDSISEYLELDRRRDLRNETIFTIDGEDSKDFDDAISIGILDNGNYLLGVHIADVSHYVAEGGALDEEAFKRGTSVYLLDQVIPMLPKVLSNDLCSLRPGEERLTLSVDMEISPEGKVVDHEIYESVICSKARLVYDDVSDLLEGVKSPINDELIQNLNERAQANMGPWYGLYDDAEQEASGKALIVGNYMKVEKALFVMNDLAEVLRHVKEERGSIDFDVEEASITLDETGTPVNVGIAQRRTANRMIEEFMLMANEVVAEHFRWMEMPFIYRVHEKPDMEKMERLRTFLQSFGIPFKSSTDDVHPKTLTRILDSVSGSTYENVINTVMLRSMQKAYYSTSCDGHFGLALENYCHFTSPIRRYPDLVIHRIIKQVLQGKMTEKSMEKYAAFVNEAAEISSKTERDAVEAEREVEKLKKAEYMEDHIGEIHDGIISGVAGFGMFVQLDNTIEGLVKLEDIFDDYYEFIPEEYMLLGTNTGHRYRIGDRVIVMVESVDVSRREINFTLA